MDVIIQVIGFAALFAGVISFQFKNHRNIMLCKTISELIFTLQYALLDAWTAVFLSFISVIRNMLFRKLVKANRSTKLAIWGFGVSVIVIGIVTYDGFISLLPIASKLLSTISYGMKREKLLRLITLPSCIFWIIYNLSVGSIAGALTDGMNLLSLLIAIYKFDIRNSSANSSTI